MQFLPCSVDSTFYTARACHGTPRPVHTRSLPHHQAEEVLWSGPILGPWSSLYNRNNYGERRWIKGAKEIIAKIELNKATVTTGHSSYQCTDKDKNDYHFRMM